ncbi:MULTISPECIES: hypothetical protein [unclassified Microbacterium]|uniref:hypothetical protein n=1 Tax=unclassified Microbacterium TaxID=2609290 RepID=UPI0012FC275A|nr:hypothetical protein [Microbacterium sp. MAH-37]MVQ42606.1 hypothetical protein [Microbacterium sp. MAH-37]
MTMPADDRLRELQRRAYGPGGGLNAAEADELAALQAAVRSGASAAAATAPVSPVAGAEIERPATVETGVGEAPRAPATVETGAEEAAEAPEVPAQPGTDPARAADPERGAQRRDEGRGAPRRRRILLAVAALASALLIGLGAGWLLFGRDGGPAMTAEQRAAWTDFEASGTYDPGSVRMVGEKYGVTAWYATKSDLHLECIMLTPLPEDAVSCATPPDPKADEQAYWGQLAVSGQLDESGNTTVQAYIVRDTEGGQVAIIDKWENSGPDWTTMFQGTELDIAKVIVKETGAEGEFLQVVGYDGDVPIWIDQGVNSCLYVADLESVTTKLCGLDLTTEGATARVEEPGTAYVVRVTNHGPVVTVIKGAVPTPSSPDEPAIDDSTGKTQ